MIFLGNILYDDGFKLGSNLIFELFCGFLGNTNDSIFKNRTLKLLSSFFADPDPWSFLKAGPDLKIVKHFNKIKFFRVTI